jgi:hypothetical protein
LVGLQPDIIVTGSTPATVAVQRETRTIPIVMANVAEPVAGGLVPRLNQPGGNTTGFANFEPTVGGKWLELLSEIAPGLKRAAFMFNPDTTFASVFLPSLETAARSLKVEPIIAHIHTVTQGRADHCAHSQRRRDRNRHHRSGARAGWRPRRHAASIHERASRVDHIGGGPKQRTSGLCAI